MATVIIWNNNLFTFGHSIVGHAAINITDYWNPVQTASLPYYASFWPEGSAKLMQTRHAEPTPNFFAALDIEGYVPDHIIRIHGLDENKMLAKWNEIRSKSKVHYKLVRKNCATVAARVLKKGSKKGGMTRHHAIWTPLDVKRLALEMGGTQMSWDDFVQELHSAKAIDDKGQTAMKKYKRREGGSGSSGAAPRFVNGTDTGKVPIYVSMLSTSPPPAVMVSMIG
ncbi:Uncharacterized protein OS=Acidiphilium multivorum (strain DSM 11245 / JCM 8867 / AIU301) GN=ACMV_24800 PE=4 SV=1 [Gemmata massiliana]|uniref:DUF4105 domain-containing protein n=1 Tax=Gemmata massiliana TaxID=1210884 RepID=A0A6P2CXP1_9BACT|nr:hypothetical protein [Gemmata massiliana]VTR93146.1 Uncharacterized protein OS=Acidiphilium multivorum (strain DSM 11245 / JCM 8867 / AIU301) GN=ACMV_24800 PE=4 SV=1 [Gemmata massiliana]